MSMAEAFKPKKSFGRAKSVIKKGFAVKKKPKFAIASFARKAGIGNMKSKDLV